MAAVDVFFYREGLQVPPQPAGHGQGHWYPWEKEPWLPKKEEEKAQMMRDRGGNVLLEVEGTHSSFGKIPPTTMLEAEVGVGAIDAGELLPTASIQVCWGSDRADLSGAEAPQGPDYRYGGCRGKPAGALCPERGGRIP